MALDNPEATQCEASPPSLGDLQLAHEELRKELRKSESSHEFYLAMWKSAPYALIALISASALAFLTSSPVYLILGQRVPAYAIGPMIGFALVLVIGYVGWWTQRKIAADIAETKIRADETERQLDRRITKIEAQIISSHPASYLCYYENFAFDERLRDARPSDFAPGIIPQILADMKHLDGDLIDLMDEYDKTAKELHTRIVSFYDVARARLEVLDKSIGVSGAQPPDREPGRIRSLYFLLGGLVTSMQDVIQEPGKRPKVYNIQPTEVHFIQLLFEHEDAKNPYPRLLQDPDLKNAAVKAEESRMKALARFTTIDQIIRVKYVPQQEFRPGI